MAKKKSDDRTAETSADISEQIKKVMDQIDDNEDVINMKKQAKDVADKATELIVEYPIQSVLGAAVVGFALGLLIGRRK